MRVCKIDIKNFRLLKDVELSLDENTTVIVGRNNSGKTSITELFRRLLSDNQPTFRLEDFSLSSYEAFWKAYQLYRSDENNIDLRTILPFIEVRIKISYKNDSEFGPLSEFIIDLDPELNDALIVYRYQLKEGMIDNFFEGIDYEDDSQIRDFLKTIRDRIPRFYESSLLAVDPGDEYNQKHLEINRLRILIQGGFINANRALGDATLKEKEVLGKIFESLFKTAQSDLSNTEDHDISKALEEIIHDIEDVLDSGFKQNLRSLTPELNDLGYPGFVDPGITTETELDISSLLSNQTKICYTGVHGVSLPESYNGLGPRNLIYILFKIFEFFKLFAANNVLPVVHMVFIEEPEAHLHPQMQEVFIRMISKIALSIANKQGIDWPFQFIITTHSSHIANEADFDMIRYFLAKPENENKAICSTIIKDLSLGLGGISEDDKKFLHQYMTLTRCDLMFADKAILIEGVAERIMMSRMIEKIDEIVNDEEKLSSQYIAIMEVSGAYAHKFFDLLDFLLLESLVITDIDSINTENHRQKCIVHEGNGTSNACIKEWFSNENISTEELLGKSDQEKCKPLRRIAYQIPEITGGPCGRSFEDAFVLANQDMFEIDAATVREKESCAMEKLRGLKKTEFALKYAIDEPEWAVPKYITEGLSWLREQLAIPEA